jgi:hypothetical protein
MLLKKTLVFTFLDMFDVKIFLEKPVCNTTDSTVYLLLLNRWENIKCFLFYHFPTCSLEHVYVSIFFRYMLLYHYYCYYFPFPTFALKGVYWNTFWDCLFYVTGSKNQQLCSIFGRVCILAQSLLKSLDPSSHTHEKN